MSWLRHGPDWKTELIILLASALPIVWQLGNFCSYWRGWLTGHQMGVRSGQADADFYEWLVAGTTDESDVGAGEEVTS